MSHLWTPRRCSQPPDPDHNALLQTLVGRTVTGVHWNGSANDCSCCDGQGSEYALIALDDGRTIMFGAWGHSWWGATIDEVAPVVEGS